MRRLFKNQQGFSQHLLLPILVIVAVAGIGGYVLTRSRAASSACVYNNYALNTSGTCVKNIQLLVNHFCLFAYQKENPCKQIAVDGQFGSQTKTQVLLFQKWSGLHVRLTQDGIVGPNTWSQLCEWPTISYPYWGKNPSPVYAGAYIAFVSSGCHQRWPNLTLSSTIK